MGAESMRFIDRLYFVGLKKTATFAPFKKSHSQQASNLANIDHFWK